VRITPRKEEVEPLAELLDSGEHDSPEALAKAVIVHVADLLWFRDWYVLAVKDGAAFGPFASEAEAATFGRKYEGALVPDDPHDWGVVTVHGLGSTAESRAGGGFGYCATEGCGHPAYTHSMVSNARGKCVLASCNCGTYEQRKPRTKKK
jgi:hypothetical protein